MKYEIETQMVTVGEGEGHKIDQILQGDLYEIIDMIEAGELMDDEETARKEFDGLTATARRREDGKIDIRIPVLIYGQEELEEDVLEGDEPFYYLAEYEEIDRRDFDDESWELFRELGF